MANVIVLALRGDLTLRAGGLDLRAIATSFFPVGPVLMTQHPDSGFRILSLGHTLTCLHTGISLLLVAHENFRVAKALKRSRGNPHGVGVPVSQQKLQRWWVRRVFYCSWRKIYAWALEGECSRGNVRVRGCYCYF